MRAVSVNPVDTKVRRAGAVTPGEPRVLGWDAAGVVKAVGPRASRFQPGDRVFYAGDISRAGSNAELQAVDERIVGPMPRSLDFADAASLPLTSITAWELLFDRLQAHAADPIDAQVLLVVGAAGGVGSVLTQLARRLTGLTVVGTASRAQTRDWVLAHGAHHVIDHHQPWAAQLAALALPQVSHVASLNHSDRHAAQAVEVLRPEGRFALIDDPASFDIAPFKSKSISLHWELMYTRSLFGTRTLERQHQLLARVAALVDAGDVVPTVTQRLQGISASTLREAHRLVEAGSMIGKVVLER